MTTQTSQIILKSRTEIDIMRIAGRICAETHEYIRPFVKAGARISDLDKEIYKYIISRGCFPSFLGYKGFPSSACFSVNSVAVHGPATNYVLKQGDIITVDIGVIHKNYHGDCARTHIIGNIPEEVKTFIETARLALQLQKNLCVFGAVINDIAFEVQNFVEAKGYQVVKELGGHGIGNSLHEEPFIPNYYDKKHGKGKIKNGMVLCFEPVITMGSAAVHVLNDKWTVITNDGSLATHEEDMVVVYDGKMEVLTKLE